MVFVEALAALLIQAPMDPSTILLNNRLQAADHAMSHGAKEEVWDDESDSC
jgi:hypothetical protein